MQLWLKFYLRVVGVSRRNRHDAGLPQVREFSCMECVECKLWCWAFLCLSSSKVATSDGYCSTVHLLNYDFGFETVFRRIQVTIKDCGNSIDTYYKQSLMGKISALSSWFHGAQDTQSSSTRLKSGRPIWRDISTISRTIVSNYKKLSLSLRRFECQTPHHKDEQSSIAAIQNQARLGKDTGRKDAKPRRSEQMEWRRRCSASCGFGNGGPCSGWPSVTLRGRGTSVCWSREARDRSMQRGHASPAT